MELVAAAERRPTQPHMAATVVGRVVRQSFQRFLTGSTVSCVACYLAIVLAAAAVEVACDTTDAAAMAAELSMTKA